MSEHSGFLKRILDGDTLDDVTGTRHRIRGINSPEKGRVGDAEATEFATEFASGDSTLERTGEVGVYGREISDVVSGDGRSLAYESVRQGKSLPYPEPDGQPSDFIAAAQFEGALDVIDGRTKPDPSLGSEYLQGILNRGPEDNTREPGLFGRSFVRGGNQLDATLYGFGKAIGDLTGIDYLSERGLEGIQRNIEEASQYPAEIQSIDDVDSLDAMWTFMVEGLGEHAPQLLGDAGAALFGGGVGGVIAKRQVMKQLTRNLGPEFAEGFRNNMATKGGDFLTDYVKRSKRRGVISGARTAALAAIYPQTAGETNLGFVQEGIDAPGTALGVGAAKAALEYLPLEVGVRNLTKMTGMGAKQVGALVGRVLGMAGIEGSTESVQTIMDLAARNFEQGKELMDFSPEDWEEVRTSGAKGAVVGGGISTAGAIPAAVSGAAQTAGALLVRRQMERESVGNPAPNDETPPPGAPSGAEEQDFREGLAGGSATVAEGAESIRAQLGELFNRDSGKNAVFISASEDPSVLKEARTRIRNRPAFIIVQTDEGNLVIQKGKGFDEAAYKNADAATQDDIRAQLLGYQYNKRDLAGQTDLSVVRTKNKDGVVIHSEIAPTSSAQSVIQNQQAMFKMSDEATTEVVSMEQEIGERPASETQDPQDTAPVEEAVEETTDTATDTATDIETNAPIGKAYKVNIKGKPYSITIEDSPNEAGNIAWNASDGIHLVRGLTKERILDYLLSPELGTDTQKRQNEVRQEVNAMFENEYGKGFFEMLSELDENQLKQLIVLHEDRHSQQRKKHGANMMSEYRKNPAAFEFDANRFALRKLGIIDGATQEATSIEEAIVETKQLSDYPLGDTVEGYKTRASAQGRATTLNKTGGDHQVIEYAPNEAGTVFYGVRNRQKEKLENIPMTEAEDAIGPNGEPITVSETNARDTIDEIDARISIAEQLRKCVLK
jgi:hypothetical protein